LTYGTEHKLAELMSRDLRQVYLVALLMDGVHFGDPAHRWANIQPALTLERVLSSTDLIENLFGRMREIGRRVEGWKNGTMVLRWTAAGALEAARGFRKLVGYRALPIVIAALHTRTRRAIVPTAGLTILRRPLNRRFAAHSVLTAKWSIVPIMLLASDAN
jgi:hypothetical protein